MASKKSKDLETSDWDLDDDLDLPDFDFDAEMPKDDRKPGMKIATSFAEGAKDTLLSGGFLRERIKKDLPKGYGKGLNTVDSGLSTLRQLYNTGLNEARPMVADMKRLTKRMLPTIERYAPKKVAEKAKTWSESGEKKASMSPEEIREAGLQAQLNDVFASQAEERQKRANQAEARDSIREQIGQIRHRDQMGQLDAIGQGVGALQQYQEKVTAQYQRKSLELQYRHYFVAMDMLEEQRKVNVTTTEYLANITKNTALPEFVKITQSERAAEILRSKFISSVADTIFDKRRDFLRNLSNNLVAGMKTKVRDFSDNVRNGFSMADTMLDMQEMQDEMGGGPTPDQLAGQMAGGLAADTVGGKLGAWAGKKARGKKSVRKWGNKLQYVGENIPQLGWNAAKSDYGNDAPLIGGLVRFFKEAMGSPNASYGMQRDEAKQMQGPAIFSNQTRKTINEVIPSLLAKMYQELQIIRTGDSSIDLVRYDFTKNKFVSDTEVRNRTYKALFKDSDLESHQKDVDELLNDIDPESDKLSPDARKTLGEFLFRDNMGNNLASAKRLSQYETFAGSAGAHGDELSEFFKEYFKGDDEGQRELKFSQKYNNLGKGLSDIREQVQMYINLGMEDVLEDMGLLDDSGSFDQRKMLSYFSGAETYNYKGGGPGGRARRAKGAPPEPPPAPTPPAPPPLPGPMPPVPNGGGAPPTPVPAPTVSFDSGKLETVIREESAKTPAQAAAEVLGRIEAMLKEGITMNVVGGAPGGDGERKKLSDMTLADSINAVGDGVRWGWNKGTKLATGVWDGAWKNAKRLGKGAKNLLDTGRSWAKGKIDDLSDVYIEINGQIVPLLTSFKLRAGHYVDDATGKVITKWSEATGAIRDTITGELITVEQMKEAFSKTKYGEALFQRLGAMKDWVVDKAKKGYGLVGSFYGSMWEMAKKGYDQLDKPCDVYVPSRKEPVLLALTMRGGGYFSKLNRHAITKPSLIDGPVVNERNEEVLTEEMLKEGLYDQFGVPLRTGWKKILAYGVAAVRKTWDKVSKAGKWLKDKANGAWDSIAGGLGNLWGRVSGPDGLIVAGGSKIHDVLVDIYNLLDYRLDGKPTGLHSSAAADGDKPADAAPEGSPPGAPSKSKGKGFRAGARLRAARGAAKNKAEDLKEKAKAAKDKVAEAAGDVKEKVKEKSKKIVGDADGDGVRDGSIRDQAIKAKEIAKEKLEQAKLAAAEKGNKVNERGRSALAALLDRARKRDEEKEESDEGGDTNINLGGGGESEAGDGKKKKKKKRTREQLRRARERYNRINRVGRFGRAAQIGRGVAGAIGSTALNVGKGALLATGLIGEGALATAGALGSAAVSGTMAAASAVGSGLVAAGGAIAGFLSAPVVLGALAVGGLAVAGYYGYKYLTKKRLKPLNTVRYAQYGFLASDEEHLQAVMGLEDKVKKGVKYENDIATLSMADMDVKAMAESFGIDLKDKASVDSWFLWFRDRFKPVYLTSLTALRRTNKEVSLDDIDSDLTPIQKQTYLNLAKFLEGPYGVLYSPFGSREVLKAGVAEVRTAVDLAMASVQRELEDKPATDKEKLTQAAVLGAGGATLAQMKDAENTRFDKDKIEGSEKSKRDAAMQRNRMLIGGGVGFSAQSFKGADLPKGRKATDRMDALTVVRYKTYGLKEMDFPRVKALDALEEAVERKLEVGSDGIAVWKGDPKEVLASNGGSFGINGVTNTQAFSWLMWFNYRFLPTYLNYATAIYRNTNRNKPSQGIAALKPAAAVDVATVVYTTNSAYDSRMLSVFTVTKSPWPDYELNTDVKSVDLNMQALKEAAKNAILGETKGRIDPATLARPENKLLADITDRYSKSKEIDFKNNPSMLLSTVDKGRDLMDAGTKYAGGLVTVQGTGLSMIPGGAGSYSGGAEVMHPGKGTGGDINSMPSSQTKGWASQGPIIQAAARMVGFDPNLMASIAAAESGFNPNVGAGTSSAVGLYQFLTRDTPGRDSTWTAMKKKYGGKWGIAPNTPATDARANALLGAEFMKDNMNFLSKKLGRPVTDTDIYMAHFLGPGGALKFLKADPNTVSTELFPTEAASNKPVFYHDGNKATRPKTTGEIYQYYTNLIKVRKKEFGVPDNLSTGSGGPTAPTGMTVTAPDSSVAAPAAAPASDPKVPPLLAPVPSAGNASVATPEVNSSVAPAQVSQAAPSAEKAAAKPVMGPSVASVSSAPPPEQLVPPKPPAGSPNAPGTVTQADIDKAIRGFLPPASVQPTSQKDTGVPGATSADIAGLGSTMGEGNNLAQQQVDLLTELVTAMKANQAAQAAPQSSTVPTPQRTSSTMPPAPISLKRSAG